jgi:hypothetical protein
MPFWRGGELDQEWQRPRDQLQQLSIKFSVIDYVTMQWGRIFTFDNAE